MVICLTIAIEGMDGVGKTTIGKMIAKKYNFDFISKPIKNVLGLEEGNVFNNICSNIYDLDNEILRACFFGLGNIYVSSNTNENIVIDRHLVSNYFWNGTEKSNCVFNMIINCIGIPDLTILLYASPETRMKRIAKRNLNDRDLFDLEKRVDGYDKMISFLHDFNIPYLFINTENKNIDEIVDEISIEIEKYKPKYLKKEYKKC